MNATATATATATKMTFEMLEVGGDVRDTELARLTGKPVEGKDVDFVVVATDTDGADAETVFAALVAHLEADGFKVFTTNVEFLTVRANVPKGSPLAARTKVADFVLARVDGPTLDGRRPSFVLPGTLMDDLSRRDFTVNAMARALDGSLVDPFGGLADLESMTLRFVGDAMERVREDGLRVMRAFRFMVTKGFTASEETMEVLTSPEAAEMLSKVSTERVREEMEKMLKANTLATLALFATLPEVTMTAMFPEGLRLSATMKG